ncbi:Glutamate receptor 1 [Amphibalanus amphitrite]|uniref:Glutamate receptor 1 n=1 Tax=Amphibalanus amphitrite TaxID=1232801 RepID=A0A6A4VC89_AMPAM|nr:Glutamate receptor 1 [Amphibalanus amphitrite]
MERRGRMTLLGTEWSAVRRPFVNTSDVPLRVVTIHDPPSIYAQQHPNGSVAYSGYLFQLWQIVADELGLSYRMSAPLSPGYGSLSSNGTWTGVVGDLAYGRADVALTLLNPTPERAAVVDFLDGVPMGSESTTFLVRRDSEAAPSLSLAMFASLLRPLGADVWWTLAAALLALSLVLRLSLRFSSARAEDGRLVRDMGWGSCLLAMTMTVLGQGWDRTPRSLAGRTVTIFGWMMAILIYVNYTANLMSFLTTHTVGRPINSVREFVQQPDWTLAIPVGSQKLNKLRSSRDSFERELYRRSTTGDRFISIYKTEKSMLQVFQPQVMAFFDLSLLHHFIGDEACNFIPLQSSPVKPNPVYLSIAKNRCALKQVITATLLKLHETGTLLRLKSSARSAGRAECGSQAGYRELSFGNLLAFLCLVPLGVALSLIVLALELLISRVRSPKRRRQLHSEV